MEWTEGTTAYISVIFSWQMNDAFQRAVWHRSMGHSVCVGGPAAQMNPSFCAGVVDSTNDDYPDAIAHHNPNATFTSRGCVRQCKFCAVPKTEGRLI